MSPNPYWYRQAVMYEVLVRAFQDSNGSGSGDLRGLTERLDYLQWLGIDCLWLPPFFDSPLRDGGYDIRNFHRVLPEFGTVAELQELIKQAHARGIRVIADFVVNHTSDQHQWFEASRNDPDGPFGDFYVWSDSPTKYDGARIIFIDTESSNWTYDETRGQYYWHRFFHHQPDLNYENPKVQEAMLDTFRFWLDLGLDGFRLDAVPYLFEQEGTNCENLPLTHEFLQRCRAVIDSEYTDKVLLAEANQWPEDVVQYFGTAEAPECHMAFHFPLMPRIFMGLAQGDSRPIRNIIASTPELPDNGAQWGIFLRNHDELTLEMVTDDERAFMYDHYAPHPRMKANVGIRRRLAPLVDNDPRRLKLLTALLLTLPGTPVLYYGDEIGMGDIIDLPDRDGVRTPMQWADAPGAGFTTSTETYLPIIDDAVFGYHSVNVAAQQSDPNSLLHFTRNMIGIRQNNPALSDGDFELLPANEIEILAFRRTTPEIETTCCFNLSDHAVSSTIENREITLAPFEFRIF
ncbi:maltose alpha-D-glucosyltransferase [Corynebacterium freiburgense]|uniref:maltose alpha-D-glucosyltransferase n=1 Tax=Corynebacterium freiburgense TaxID=556548 RepID=UPI00040B4BC8|nr:maltose alpha-D-glucosyltransferase [Corynebacterium freiburgense]WJZ03319.1 Trehalose synthase/amylase TreS [Corynebacterium freiburgense]